MNRTATEDFSKYRYITLMYTYRISVSMERSVAERETRKTLNSKREGLAQSVIYSVRCLFVGREGAALAILNQNVRQSMILFVYIIIMRNKY